jgi:hypothetical protein
MLAQQFLWLFVAYCWIMMAGFFITSLYYRMNKGAKIAVSVGVPVLLFYVLPILDFYLLKNALSKALLNFVSFAWGLSNGCNPFIGVASMLVLGAVSAALAWSLVRRVNVKA